MSDMHAEVSSMFLQVLLSVLLLDFTILNSKFLLFFFLYCCRATGSELGFMSNMFM